MHKDDLEKLFCSPAVTIKEAMFTLNTIKGQILLIVDKNRKLLGVLTDGDIRRALIKNSPLTTPLSLVMNTNPHKISLSDRKIASKIMKEHSIRQIPVVSDDGAVEDIVLWEDVIEGAQYAQKHGQSVVIMAGGKGSKLDPLTKILPKPLIPIGDKPIIEIVMDQCKKYGFHNFIISLNYKSAMIKHYFAENAEDASIKFIEEEGPLGTAGSLYLVKSLIKDTFIVTNCDVIIDIDYSDLLKFHNEKGFQLTTVGAVRNFAIPYGVINMDKGRLVSIVEKPEYDFMISAGVYVIGPEILALLPDNTYLDMPNLILTAKKRGYSVGVYPFSGRWIDVGQWEEYKKAIDRLHLIG